MSVTAALSNALSGLTASSRAAKVVSDNVANAMTEGYGRREIVLSSRAIGGDGAGVRVEGVRRDVDQGLIRDRRLAGAERAAADVIADFAREAMDAVGSPEDTGSLTARIADFEAALIEAAARPDSQARLANVLDTSNRLVRSFNRASDSIAQLRVDADARIAREVETLNRSLRLIEEVNAEIMRARGSGQEIVALEDRRQTLIDGIAEIIPLKTYLRKNGTVALYGATGATLLDPRAVEFGFSTTEPITADMTLVSGALSGLTINGNTVQTSGSTTPIAGGRLAALFEVRDERLPSLQSNLDKMAADLVTRFEDPSLDTTRAIGDPGLFTDGGSLLDPSDLIGLSGRLSVNWLVNPAAGGALWRLRDGLGAAAPGPVGESALLSAFSSALLNRIVPAGDYFTGAARTFSGLGADLTGSLGRDLAASEGARAHFQAKFDGLRDAELANGVDTDQEMQKLLLIEQAYAANARVIQTVDQMMKLISEI